MVGHGACCIIINQEKAGTEGCALTVCWRPAAQQALLWLLLKAVYLFLHGPTCVFLWPGRGLVLSALASVRGICVFAMPGQQCFWCLLIPSPNTSDYQSPSRIKFNSKTSSDFKAAEAQLYSSVWKEGRKEGNYSQSGIRLPKRAL